MRNRRLTINDIKSYFERFQSTYYVLDWHRVKTGPKCQWCDADGYITYTAPNGRTKREICDCQLNTKKIFSVDEVRLVRISLSDRDAVFRYDPYPQSIDLMDEKTIDPSPETARENAERYRCFAFTTRQKALEWAQHAGFETENDKEERK